jgi:hypothetical protein
MKHSEIVSLRSSLTTITPSLDVLSNTKRLLAPTVPQQVWAPVKLISGAGYGF